MTLSIGLLLAALALSGCGSGSSSPPKTTYSYVDEDQANAAKQGKDFEDPSKFTSPNPITKADLKKLQSSVDSANAAYKSKPSSATKKKLVDLTVDLASKTMDCTDLTPHEKYPAALRLYRQALSLDPSNPDANAAADTIVKIYHQMGMPVPK